jgi:hypothetical protein
MKPKKPAGISSPAASSEIVLYQTEDGRTRVECRFENENVWLTQALMAELFLTTVPNINMHLRNIYAEHELEPGATIQQYLIRSSGKRVGDFESFLGSESNLNEQGGGL